LSETQLPSSSPSLPTTSSTPSGSTPVIRKAEKKKKGFNLQTYKFHALGDYAATIRRYGTTDSFSTERVCLPLDSFETEADITPRTGGTGASNVKVQIHKDRP
jgi:hypothetical protein